MLKYISVQTHPNLVEFIEDFEHNERPYLVFELLDMDLLDFTGRYDTCRANLHANCTAGGCPHGTNLSNP